MSYDIISEIVEIMARVLLTTILEGIRKRKYFSIITDATRDISGIEQFSHCVRTVNVDFSINEDFLGLYAFSETSAVVIFNDICDVLQRYGIEQKKCRGQSYHGASVMFVHVSATS